MRARLTIQEFSRVRPPETPAMAAKIKKGRRGRLSSNTAFIQLNMSIDGPIADSGLVVTKDD